MNILEKQKISALIGVAEDVLEQLINATEDFDEPISEEEIEEYEEVIRKAKEVLGECN